MKFLLDTATFIWVTSGEVDKLSPNARQIIMGKNSGLCLSAASIWEIAIKYSLDRLELTIPPKEMVAELRKSGEIALVEVSPDHAAQVADLPFHHKDPFDRLLIAQAKIENLPILTPDQVFRKYDVEVVW